MKKILEIKTIQLTTPASPRPLTSPPARGNFPRRTREHTLPECPSQQGRLRGTKRVRRSVKKDQGKVAQSAEKAGSRIHNNPEFRFTQEISLPRYARIADEPIEEKFGKTMPHSRYETKQSISEYQQDCPKIPASKKPPLFRQNKQWLLSRQGRLNSQPSGTPSQTKRDLMQRISKKIDLMKKMTVEPVPLASSESANLFNFDRLYDYCLKRINRCIKVYEKDGTRGGERGRDSRYFQLKVEGSVLRRELGEIRGEIVRKREGEEGEKVMGVVGSLMGIGRGEKGKAVSERMAESFSRRTLPKNTQQMARKSKTIRNDIHGWQLVQQKASDFDL